MEEQNLLHKILKLWFRQKSGDGLEAKLGYRFRDPELLAHALVHRSFIIGKDLPYVSNNERLEFLGDSVLNMLTTEYLYKTYPDDPEGELSKRKSAIVSGHACAQSSKEWNLSEFVKIGKSEAKMGGRGKESILADAYEAVLGAVYLDGGLDEVRAILNGKAYARGQGPNKKRAEQEASRLSLDMLIAEAEKAEAEKAALAEAAPKIKVQKQRHVGLP